MKNIKLKNWIYKLPSKSLVEEISREFNVSPPVASVIINRGVSTLEQARDFLFPDLNYLGNPFLLPDMELAVNRIRKALDKGEKILVYGDRDVDGVASISVMIRTLESLGSKPLWYIPSDEGYGVHKEVLERYAKEGVTLIITVDCGITAVDEVAFGAGLGIDFVVTDHHEPKNDSLPKAIAIVDPKLEHSEYPFDDIAGCSVALKVAEALMLSFGKYYNKELVCLSDKNLVNGQIEVGAIKSINGLVTDQLLLSFPTEDKLSKELLKFISGNKVAVFNKEDFSFLGDSVSFISLLSLSGERFSESKTLNNPAQSLKVDIVEKDAKSEAKTVLDVFWRLENLNDLRMIFFRDNHLDVVTLGTIADIMPLVNENRVLVKQGLKRLNQSKKVGVQALMEKCLGRAKYDQISAKSISWGISPLLNAAGRRGKANLAAELLLTEDFSRARKLIEEISKLNDERKELQAENMDRFIPFLEQQCDIEKDKIFVVVAEGVEHGVTGIIASQIARQYHRPTVLLISENGQAMGSSRSIKGFDIVSCFSKVEDTIIKYGGHSQAAGLTVSMDKIDEFRKRIKEVAEREISDELLVANIEIDSELESAQANMKLYEELSELEPYGMGNPNPVFAITQLKVLECAKMGANSKHLKLRLSKNGGPAIGAVGWGLGFMDEHIEDYPLVDLAFQMEINNWQDKKSLQFLIVDIKPSVMV